METVILVDEHDAEIGSCEKLEAHRRGLRHRAFSIILDDGGGKTLLQRRQLTKYHSGGLWANACCGHPRPGEATGDAARRRLFEELGIRCALTPFQTARYRADLGGGMTEDEVVTLFRGVHRGSVRPDPTEVLEWTWRAIDDFRAAVTADGASYVRWVQEYVRQGLI